MATNGRVTLAVIATELKNLTNAVNNLNQTFSEHTKEDKAVAIIVDRLNEKETSRTWHIRLLWSTIVASVFGYFVKG